MYGNDLTGDSGQIASPLYPRTYPNNANYRWTISVEGDSFIQIQFLDMDIEDLYDCYYDQLKVRSYVLGNHVASLIHPFTVTVRMFAPSTCNNLHNAVSSRSLMFSHQI